MVFGRKMSKLACMSAEDPFCSIRNLWSIVCNYHVVCGSEGTLISANWHIQVTSSEDKLGLRLPLRQ